jgi:hypothetical protein
MKQGMILYVTEGKDEVQMQPDWPALTDALRLLGVSAIRLAISEEEIVYGWWQMLTRGMQHISCMKAAYNADLERLEPFGVPLRLCG